MERKVGTTSRGIRCPIIREGDDLADIVVTSVLEAAESECFQLADRDVVAVTESVVARAQGNYAGIEAALTMLFFSSMNTRGRPLTKTMISGRL